MLLITVSTLIFKQPQDTLQNWATKEGGVISQEALKILRRHIRLVKQMYYEFE